MGKSLVSLFFDSRCSYAFRNRRNDDDGNYKQWQLLCLIVWRLCDDACSVDARRFAGSLRDERRPVGRHQELDGDEETGGDRATPGALESSRIRILRHHRRHHHRWAHSTLSCWLYGFYILWTRYRPGGSETIWPPPMAVRRGHIVSPPIRPSASISWSKNRGRSTSVRGQVRSPHISGGRRWLSCRLPACL